MKLSENKIIKTLNSLATVALIFYGIFLLANLFGTGIPKAGKGVKSYMIYNVKVIDDNSNQKIDHLKIWFNNNLVISETDRALIHLRFKNYIDLFSLPALIFQLVQFLYWLSIGFLLWLIKRFFRSLCKNEVFSQKNASTLMFGSLLLIWLPIIRWFSQELFINCIEQLHLNDSSYALANGESLLGSETFIGLALFAFGLAFRAGVDMKKENEAFI